MALLDPLSKLLGTHTGSWGTPDLGITEGVGNVIAGFQGVQPTLTPQGGSQLQISSPADYQQVQNAVKNTTPALAPRPQTPQLSTGNVPVNTNPVQSNGGGTPPIDYSFYQGWNDQNAIAGDWASTWQQKIGQGSPGATQSGILAEVDNLYNQNNPLFDQAEANLANQVSTAEGKINTQAAQAERSYESAYEQAMKLASGHRTEAQQTQQSSESALNRTYQSLVQSLSSRFGAGNSAGLAASEIVAGELLRSSGDIRQATTNTLGRIFDNEAKAQETLTSAKQKLTEDVGIMLNELAQDFRDKMLQIQMSRVANEQAKSAARIDLLREQQANIQAINNYKVETAIQLDTWRQQQATLNAQTLGYSKQLLTDAQTNFLSDANSINTASKGLSAYTNTGTSAQTGPLSYRNPTSNRDELQSLNPWLA